VTTCAIVSFRLGLTDGVSIVAATWADALRDLGFDIMTVAGDGPVDRTVNGLSAESPTGPPLSDVEQALADADLVVVENLCTIPLNLAAARVVAEVLRGRPAILHHHDPPWQRERFASITELPPTDPAWRHVTINHLTRGEMAARGIDATTIYNGFDPRPTSRDGRTAIRAQLDVAPEELLIAHPVRAIERKNIPAALALCTAIGATYWLMGPAEDGYGPTLERLLASARCRVIHAAPPGGDLYGAPDGIVFPSTWEGFGNPPIEASLARLPVAVGSYPVGDEVRSLGFRWFDVDDPATFAAAVRHPPDDLLDHNRSLAIEHFSLDVMARRLRDLVDEAGWLP
jgi:glycosyltransferase involved in cell wall biosynthesis